MENFHENPEVLQVGCERPRSYYIPHSTAESCKGGREDSERFISLAGEWLFSYYNSYEQIPDNVVLPREDAAHWDTVTLPGIWPGEGRGAYYVGDSYPFPCDPPFVPKENPAGVYLRDYELDEQTGGMKHYLVFEGVSSCFYLYVNGNFVGYSQGSHSMSEFDISGFLVPGSNRIGVIVLTFSDGSYLESGRGVKTPGIFRRVYVLARPKGHIKDYTITAQMAPDYRSADLSIRIDSINPEEYRVSVLDPDGTLLGSVYPDSYGQAVYQIESPVVWSAETPDLYTVLIESSGECISDRVGIRDIRYEEGEFKINGRSVKLRGVTLRETHQAKIIPDEKSFTADLLLMKQHNINAIYLMGHPFDPRFTQLCDRYGFYLMCEAELCGAGMAAAGTPDYLAGDKCFAPGFLDRAERLIIRDKNRPSVIIWKLGGSLGYGENIKNAIVHAKSLDLTRPVHYEAAPAEEGESFGIEPAGDLVSLSFPSVAYCKNFLELDQSGPPLLLNGYAYSTGNGTGGLQDYFELIRQYPRFAGGFVYQWRGTAGPALDGGRTGQAPGYKHKGNKDRVFDQDGLLSPEGEPYPGLNELKYVYQPVYVEPVDLAMGWLRIHNLYSFSYLSQLECSWELSRYGQVVKSGKVDPMPIPPGRSADIQLGYELPADGRCFLRVMFRQVAGTSTVPFGTELAADQFALPVENTYFHTHYVKKPLGVLDSKSSVILNGEGFAYSFDKLTGAFSKLNVDGKRLLSRPMEYALWRAPTDDDRRERLSLWKEAGYDRAKVRVYETFYEQEENDIFIFARIGFLVSGRWSPMGGEVCWRVNPAGEIQFSGKMSVEAGSPPPPRFGVRLFMEPRFCNVEHFGPGGVENYADRKRAAHIGRFSGNVSLMSAGYWRPQECGNRHQTEWAAVYDSRRFGIMAICPDGFDFSALPFSVEELLERGINTPAADPKHTVFSIDYRQSGVGSGKDGEKYLLPRRFDFGFSLRQVTENSGTLWQTALTKYLGYKAGDQ